MIAITDQDTAGLEMHLQLSSDEQLQVHDRSPPQVSIRKGMDIGPQKRGYEPPFSTRDSLVGMK